MANVFMTPDQYDHDDTFDDFSSSLRQSIKNIIRQEGYIKYTVKKKQIPQAGNFMSFLYEVDISGETVEGEKKKSLFIKKSITLEKITVTTASDVYSRELFVYNDLFRIFSKLQDTANIPVGERFKFIKSYDSDNEAIIMENLSKKGFITYDGKKVVTIKFAELSVIELAKIHAFSYIFKQRFPKYFDDKIKAVNHIFNTDSDWEGFMHNVCAAAAQVVKEEAKPILKSYAPRMLRTYKKYLKNSVPANGCLCHGDYKILNILVKEAYGEPYEVHPIDFQLVYYGYPVDDFLFFIFTSTDREFRRKHLSYLKDIYFENFTKFLQYFNINVNSAYPRQAFEKDYAERFEMGLVFGLYMAAYTFAHIGEGFDLSKLSLSELTIVPDEMFAERVSGIVEDYIVWGYL